MCPIISACGTAIYNTAKFITKIPQRYFGKTSSYVKDSTDFIQKIKPLSINPEEEILISFDVSALCQHTSTCCTTSYKYMNIYLHQFHQCLQDPYRKMHQASGICYHSLHFLFNKKFYKQLHGAAMGSPVSPVIANIHLECFESLPIPTFPKLIKWWFRYVGDVYSTTRWFRYVGDVYSATRWFRYFGDIYSATRKDQVNKCQGHLNSIDPHIKFTKEFPGRE